MTVQDIDRGWKHIKKELAKMDDAYVKVGIQTDAEVIEGVHMAGIGAFNEFGTSRAPERSFLRSTIDEKREVYFRILANEMNKIFAGTRTAAESLGLLGQKATSDIQKKITDLKDPPNAPSTVRAKGSSNPLIDTGRMRASIRYQVEGA